ncbi:MAG: YgjP-like metallopeptidase domain-containing protein, partial [Gammaproteobacteria bacterium]
MNEKINYDIILSARKTIVIEVHANLKIFVRAPKRWSPAAIEKFIAQRRSWIQKKLDYFHKHPSLSPVRRFINGEPHLYLGKHYPLNITAGPINA